MEALLFKTGDYEKIPIYTCVVAIVSSALWFSYSFLDIEARKSGSIDIPCFIPNLVGLIFAPLQVFVWAYFRSKSNVSIDEVSIDKQYL